MGPLRREVLSDADRLRGGVEGLTDAARARVRRIDLRRHSGFLSGSRSASDAVGRGRAGLLAFPGSTSGGALGRTPIGRDHGLMGLRHGAPPYSLVAQCGTQFGRDRPQGHDAKQHRLEGRSRSRWANRSAIPTMSTPLDPRQTAANGISDFAATRGIKHAAPVSRLVSSIAAAECNWSIISCSEEGLIACALSRKRKHCSPTWIRHE